jgi:hypothetical protein
MAKKRDGASSKSSYWTEIAYLPLRATTALLFVISTEAQ